MQDFEQEMMMKIRNKNKTIHFNITNRCNAACAHCINHESATVLGEAEKEDVLEWIGQVAETDYKNINFVGGEPFLRLDDLKQYSEYGANLGLTVGATTNGFWGKSKDMAEETLDSLPYLKKILVSTDVFHQQFISIETIYHVVDACLQKKRFIAVNAVCKNKEEGNRIKQQFERYKNKIYVNVSPVMPEGNAKQIEDIDVFDITECTNRLDSYCNVREHYVDCKGGISACCMSTLMLQQNVLLLGDMKNERLTDILQRKENNSLIRLLEKDGPKGLWDRIKESPNVSELNGTYSCDCDFCRSVLGNKKLLDEMTSSK